MIISQKNVRSGFTLIEILIAVAIVGLMAAVIGPRVADYLEKSKIKATQMDLRGLKQAIDSYYMDTNEYPDKLQDLVVCPSKPEIANKWMGGLSNKKYIPKIKKDSWGNDFIYKKEQYKDNPYTLYSYGPEGKKSKKLIHVWDID